MSALMFVVAAMSAGCACTAWDRERGVAILHVAFGLFFLWRGRRYGSAAVSTPDMFGGVADKPRSPHYVRPRGYAAPPGTGPDGQCCGTCKWAVRHRRWSKCHHPIRRYLNTAGSATDILLRTAACSKWEAA